MGECNDAIFAGSYRDCRVDLVLFSRFNGKVSRRARTALVGERTPWLSLRQSSYRCWVAVELSSKNVHLLRPHPRVWPSDIETGFALTLINVRVPGSWSASIICIVWCVCIYMYICETRIVKYTDIGGDTPHSTRLIASRSHPLLVLFSFMVFSSVRADAYIGTIIRRRLTLYRVKKL